MGRAAGDRAHRPLYRGQDIRRLPGRRIPRFRGGAPVRNIIGEALGQLQRIESGAFCSSSCSSFPPCGCASRSPAPGSPASTRALRPFEVDPHSGEIWREAFLVPLGMSAHAPSQAIHVPATHVNAIVNGKRGISADTALRLARYFGNSPEFWLNLQAAYRSACRGAGGIRENRARPRTRRGSAGEGN